MESYHRALIEAARSTRLQARKLCELGRKLRDEANQYRQVSYSLNDLNRIRQNRRSQYLPKFPAQSPAQSKERRP